MERTNIVKFTSNPCVCLQRINKKKYTEIQYTRTYGSNISVVKTKYIEFLLMSKSFFLHT